MPKKARLVGELDLNKKPFTKALDDGVREAKIAGKKMQGSFTGLTKQFRLTEESGSNIRTMLFGMGATAVLAGAAGARSIIQFGDEVEAMSGAVGMGSEEFQKFTYAIEQGNGRQNDFVTGMGALIARQQDAIEGNEQAEESFAEVGISMNDLRRKSPSQLLLMISDALKKSGGDAKTTAATMELLGSKVALKLIPSLKDGSAAFLQMGNDANVMTDQTIKDLAAIDAAMVKTFRNLKVNVGNFAMDVAAGIKAGELGNALKDAFGDIGRNPLANLASGGITGLLSGLKGGDIKSPAPTNSELNKARLKINRQKPALLPSNLVAPAPVIPFADSRFGVNGLRNNALGFNSSLKGASMGSPGKFATAFTPSLNPTIGEGSMLGSGQGLSGNAYGLVRSGDRARAKAADKERENEDLLKAARATASSTAALAIAWGAKGVNP